jgi:hypothetical protein
VAAAESATYYCLAARMALGLPTASAFMLARRTYAFLAVLEHSDVVLGHLVADALVTAGLREGAAAVGARGQCALLMLTVTQAHGYTSAVALWE